MNGKNIKRMLSLALALVFALGLAPAITPAATAAAPNPNTDWYTGGGPYTIGTAEELAGLAKLVNDQTDNFSGKTITLTANLDLAGIDWAPIGDNSDSTVATRFLGTFDGGGHVIMSLTVNVTGVLDPAIYAGLFGYIGTGGEVKNLGIVGGSVTASGSEYTYAGGVAGVNSGEITNCYNTGDVTASGGNTNYAGGVAGANDDTITNCYNTGNVEASGGYNNYAGGVAGWNVSGTITNCYNTGDVTASGSDNHAGGVAGWNNGSGAIITNCYNTGDVTASGNGTNYAGGVAGRNSGSAIIANCYNTGNVEASGGFNSYVGGVAGDNSGSVTITNCYRWEGVTVTQGGIAVEDVDANGINGGVKSAQELVTRATYSDNGWDFDVNWRWDSAEKYPKLGFGPEVYPFPFTAPQTGGPSVSYYTVKFDSNGGGAVTFQSVAYGGKAAKPADPEREGYEFTGWYTDAECTTLYDFSAPIRGGLTLYAGWVKLAPGLPNLFDDDDGHWAEKFINSLGAQGYVSGVGGRTFGPYAALTRAQFVQVVYNAFGEDETAQSGVPFKDCDPDEWYFTALCWAYGSGIISGYSDAQFGPDDPISREQMAVLTVNAAEVFGVKLTESAGYAAFADDGLIASYAKDAVYALQAAGIIEGKTGNLFDPQGTLSRAEMAKVMYGLLSCAGKIAEEYRIV